MKNQLCNDFAAKYSVSIDHIKTYMYLYACDIIRKSSKVCLNPLNYVANVAVLGYTIVNIANIFTCQ